MGSLDPTVAGLIWSGIAGIVLVLGLLCALEAFLYFTGRARITTYIRTWSRGHIFLAAVIAALLVAGVSMAVTHFVLDA